MARLSIRSRDADEDREGDILLDHGLRGGSLILLNLLRESRDSGEDEESGDCEISDGLVHRVSPFVSGDLFNTPYTNESVKGYKKNSRQQNNQPSSS